MLSLLVILFGVVKQFFRFWIWPETECKTPQNMVYTHNSTPPPAPLPPVREKIEGQHKNSFFVHEGNSSQAGLTMTECVSSL